MNSILDLLEQPEWLEIIRARVPSDTLQSLSAFLLEEENKGKTIFPQRENWFRALNEVAPDKVKVVILGQDPYHGPGQAQGLSFSVPAQFKVPPSLKNIFKEQQTDLAIENTSGDLSYWAEQGVLLLNAVFTVEASKAGSHAKHGWEIITDALIAAISEQQKNIVFLLWGAFAEKKSGLIDESHHLILTAAHPSPLSAYRGWFGCQHFSKANAYLKKNQRAEIDWRTSTVTQLSLLS